MWVLKISGLVVIIGYGAGAVVPGRKPIGKVVAKRVGGAAFRVSLGLTIREIAVLQIELAATENRLAR